MKLKRILAGVMAIVFSLNLIQINVKAEENTEEVKSENTMVVEKEVIKDEFTEKTSEDDTTSEVLVKVKDGTVYVLKTAGNGALYVAKAAGSGLLFMSKEFFGPACRFAGIVTGILSGIFLNIVVIGIGSLVVIDKFADSNMCKRVVSKITGETYNENENEDIDEASYRMF